MSTMRFRRDLAAKWILSNRILDAGEPGYELDTGKLKIGNGATRWNDLDYVLADDELRRLIDEAISELEPSDLIITAHQELVDHIDSLTPHPVYDDGPSFVLLYQNAKV